MPKETFARLLQEKQNRILTIAANEFAAHPYRVASISRVVRLSGIAKGSFYQYFEDKKDLYRTLVEISSEKKLNLLREIPSPDPNGDLFTYFKWQFLSTIIFELRYPDFAQILYRAFVEEVPFPDITEELRRRGTTQFFKQLIAQGIAHGDVAVWVDPDIAAFLLETLFYQFGKYFITRLNLSAADTQDQSIFTRPEAQQIIQNLMDILEAGIKRDPEQRDTYFNKA